MSLFKGKRAAVGLEIGSFSIKALELAKSVPYEIVQYAEEEIGNGAVVDGEINEAGEVTEAIKKLWLKGKFSTKKVVLGVANPKVLVRQVELPFMEDSALRSAINFQAQEYIPFSPDELILDYHVLGKFENDENQQMLEILLVAANIEMVSSFCTVAENAGLQVEVVYLSALALARALLDPSDISDGDTKPVVIANMSADISNIVLAEKGFARFARIMTFGGSDFSEALTGNLGVSSKEAEELKKNIGLLQKNKDEIQEGGIDHQKVSSILGNVANKFANELKRSIEYYFSDEASSGSIDKLILTGGGSQMPGLDRYLEKKLKIKTERGRSLGKLNLSKTMDPEGSRQMIEHEPAMGVLIGLAMRGLT